MTMTATPETARAAVLHAYREPLEIREVTVPAELEPRSILVRVEAATLCGTDVHLCAGNRPMLRETLPAIPGHEMVGTIVEFGEGERRDSMGAEIEIGDRIVWTPASCFSCFACTMLHQPAVCENRRYYMTEDCGQYPYLTGGLAQYCYVFPGSQRIRVPDDLPDEWASGSSCALRTVMATFDRLEARINGFQTLVIQGAGPLGLFATALARWSGVKRVIVIGGPAERLEVASAWGASEVISVEECSEPAERVAAVKDLTGGHGAEIVIELSGARSAFAEGVEMVRPSGQYLVTGQTTSAASEIVASTIVKKNLTISGSLSADGSHYWKALQFISRARDEVPFERMFSGAFALEEASTAMQRMQRFEEIKPVIYPWGKPEAAPDSQTNGQ
jgi:threonine dehydrogenase-like Zn-dependent dehydrogenase